MSIITTTPILSLLASIAKANVTIGINNTFNEITLSSTGDEAFDWLVIAAGDEGEQSEWYGSKEVAPGWEQVQKSVKAHVDGYTFAAFKLNVKAVAA